MPLTDERRARIDAGVDAMADDAMRTLAVAFRRLDDPATPMDESLEHDLTFVGTVGIVDPPREEARQAIAEAHAAGIRIVMITGDHPRTAGRIAQQLGITDEPDAVVTGVEIDAHGRHDLPTGSCATCRCSLGWLPSTSSASSRRCAPTATSSP